ncbi:snRNA-activating protein complex subunit 1 [Diachasma alloeum]|uniref:snRNA-activating protein complex subunit 1 n=1 Tax=Diachasma alloeum TaxID=454923 RepID=UPI0007382706|nr:snRNA-activating protein complex subunit 1 [Diachasma alloeum]XP_015115867.1 snRNA-activating protein complex subunit 1 [Diachasma alloeum]XP_028982085.1 snRNA-activating protein complex subunit 1 [Diachasma alloeum]
MENSEPEKVVIAPGFKEDCVRILTEFEGNGDWSFQGFCEVWRRLKFTNVYWNRSTEAEMLEFCEEALAIAKEFISPAYNDTQRLGGIFLLYGLFFKSLVKGPKIRLTRAEWENVVKLRDELFKDERFEAVYVLNNLIESHAFAFCFKEREKGLENYYIVRDAMTKDRAESSRSKPNEIISTLTEILSISDSYIQTKSKLIESSTGTVPKLYNGLVIERLLTAIETIQDSKGKKMKKRRASHDENFTMDSSSLESDGDDDNFDPDMSSFT